MQSLGLEIRGVVCALAPVADHSSALLAQEARCVAQAVAKRRNEFSTGRCLARELMKKMGYRDQEILFGRQREPLWPEGVVGSITHNDTHAAVAVAERRAIENIGIDLETQDRLTPNLFDKLLTKREQDLAARIDPTLLFSAKEACYKFIYPIVRSYVDYLDVEVEPHFDSQTFQLRYIGTQDIAAIIERAQGQFCELRKQWFCCVSAQPKSAHS